MKHIEDDILKLCSFARSGLMTMQGKEYHRITHTECDFNDDHKHRVSVLNQNITLVNVYELYCNREYSQWTVASPSFVRTRLDKSATVVVEVTSFVGNPVGDGEGKNISNQ